MDNPFGDIDNPFGNDDFVLRGNGDDRISTGDGDDTILADPGPFDSIGGDDTVYAGDDDDLVRAFGGDNVIYGGDGDDTLITADGNDFIDAGDGDDDDVQSGRGADTVFGGKGNDTLRGGEGNDFVDGGPGHDRVIGSSDDDTVIGGTGNDRVEGRDGNDSLDGGGGRDTLEGGADNDRLDGGGDNDTLFGETGNDLLVAGQGDDLYDGGGGDDTLSFAGWLGGVSADLGAGTASGPETGTDTVIGIEHAIGGGGGDALAGNGGANSLDGGAGGDTLRGDAGNDSLDGGPGDDIFVLPTGSGDDTLFFENGADRIDVTGRNLSWSVLQTRIEASGSDVLVDLGGGDSARLKSTTVGQVDVSDFIGLVSGLFGDIDPQLLLEMAQLSDLAYEQPDLGGSLASRGWSLIEPTITSGSFNADGYFINDNAAAIVAVKDNMLTLSIRGADFPNLQDLVDASFNQDDYYALLQPLIDTALDFAGASPEIDTMVVTGHSLGGAMAGKFAADVGSSPPEGLSFTIATFGSPGVNTVSANPLSMNMVEVFHTGDAIPSDPVLGFLETNGSPVPISLETIGDSDSILGDTLFHYLFGLPDEHRLEQYVDSVTKITASTLYDHTAPNTASFLLADNAGALEQFTVPSTATHTLVLGLGGADVIFGGNGADLLDGGDGNDTLDGGTGNDALAGGGGDDTLIGGGGDDILYGDGGPGCVRVRFISEEAGYQSTYGWYNTDTGEAHILVANVDTVTNPGLENFVAELSLTPDEIDRLDFFLIPDGYRQNADAGEPLAHGDPTSLDLEVFQDGDVWKIRDTDSGYVLEGSGSPAYFTETDKNPDGLKHVDDEDRDLITDGAVTHAWEDLPNLGDGDFGDAVFQVETAYALEVSFVSESAGYRSSYGAYDTETGAAHLLVANVDTTTNPGLMDFTASLCLTQEELDHLGFFLIPDGFRQNGDAGEPFANGTDPTALDLEVFQDGDVWKIRDTDSGYVFEGRGNPAYFTETDKNPDGLKHVDDENRDLIADGAVTHAWEDLPNLGDGDFGDAVFELSLAGGAPGNDLLIGGAGYDALAGGLGADTFHFEGTDFGQDEITDFALGKDKIVFEGVGVVDDPDDLTYAVDEFGEDIRITFDDLGDDLLDEQIELLNVGSDVGALKADMLFV